MIQYDKTTQVPASFFDYVFCTPVFSLNVIAYRLSVGVAMHGLNMLPHADFDKLFCPFKRSLLCHMKGWYARNGLEFEKSWK